MLETASEVIDALGGTTAAARALGTTPQAVCNWRATGQLPIKRFFVISGELEKIGKVAPLSLFGFDEVA